MKTIHSLTVLAMGALLASSALQANGQMADQLQTTPPCGGNLELTEVQKGAIESAGTCTDGWNVVTIRDNGPSENRYDIAVLGDGFVDDPSEPQHNLARYQSLTEEHIDRLFQTQPYSEYANYFNVHRVEVISVDPCIDYPPTGLLCDTALDFGYGDDNSRPLRCIIGSFSKMSDAAGCAPDWQVILGLANSTVHGGCAAGRFAHVAGKSTFRLHTTVHELGHSIGRLADEYVTNNIPYPFNEPSIHNVSKFTASQQTQMMTKWYRWLDVPGVSTYEGNHYYRYDVFRATANSAMRTVNVFDFGPVNSEGLVIEIYKVVSTIDSVTPPEQKQLLPVNTVFQVDVIQPVSQTVEVQWFLDGTAVPGATGQTFQIPNPGSLPDGIYEVSVRAVDQTLLVRDMAARDAHLTETKTWNVGVGNVCLGNVDCKAYFYCDKEVGDCDGAGSCKKRPTVCPQYFVYDPICGCDGNEYAGECDAHAVGVNVVSLSECPCRENEDCVSWRFCLQAECRPFSSGECTDIPYECSTEPDPVCGCDGEEYLNECEAHAASTGTFTPSGDTCDRPGGCCLGQEGCAAMTESECEANCGVFNPFGLCLCSYARGSCCFANDECELSIQPVCECRGGVFREGLLCPCPQFGRCCSVGINPNNPICEDISQKDCSYRNGGVWTPESSCADDGCGGGIEERK